MALEAAVDGVRRVLKEEKTDRNAAFAVKNCQVKERTNTFQPDHVGSRAGSASQREAAIGAV